MTTERDQQLALRQYNSKLAIAVLLCAYVLVPFFSDDGALVAIGVSLCLSTCVALYKTQLSSSHTEAETDTISAPQPLSAEAYTAIAQQAVAFQQHLMESKGLTAEHISLAQSWAGLSSSPNHASPYTEALLAIFANSVKLVTSRIHDPQLQSDARQGVRIAYTAIATVPLCADSALYIDASLKAITQARDSSATWSTDDRDGVCMGTTTDVMKGLQQLIEFLQSE
jgi:hypothetical protein